ncbi:unnamed protein product [Adineta steineri]|nr:unnamed protein product [Adineta steineri]
MHTSLNGYNELNDRWISELDCLDRCLKLKPEKCRSFEHWYAVRTGLCVRANISLSDEPSSIATNSFVDYYEIDCRKDTKAVRLQTISCPGDQLNIIITLNGIDPNYVLLGDSNCKPLWSNETHAQFVTHILTDGSIVGKLRWEGVDKDTNEARQYGRFFLCPSDIYQIRLAHWTSTTMRISTTASSTRSTPSLSATHHHLTSPIYNDEQLTSTTYRISLRWISNNRTYTCPQICSVSLLSLIYVSFDDISLLSSTFSIHSCDLIALHPYTNYFKTHRLIYQDCSADPTVIHLSSEINSLSKFHYSFYLYNILREPIPFQIQCRILNHQQTQFVNNHTKCSSLTFIDNDQLSIIKNEKKDYSYTLFRSSPVNVTRHSPSNLSELNGNYISIALIAGTNANIFSRSCKCKAVSNTVHFPFHSWDISSCKLCSCNDAAMVNCEQACASAVQSYATTGCGKVTKGSKVKYSWDASSCSGGIGQSELECA